jgi:putative flippase GtrA
VRENSSVVHRAYDEIRTRGVRFILVGLVNSAFGFAAYSMFTWLGYGYFLSSALATVAGVLFNYRTTRSLVFMGHDGTPFWRFVASYAVILAFTVTLLEISGIFGMDPYLAGLLISIPSAALSYVLQRQFVFRKVQGS